MTQNDPILELIRQADDAARKCQAQVDVQQIYVRDQHIRRTRQGVGVTAMLALVLSVVLSLYTQSKPDPDLTEEGPSLAVLETQADRLLARVDFLQEMDREVQKHLDIEASISSLETKLKQIKDPLDQVNAELDKVARSMVASAEHFESTPGLRREAIKEYRKVVDLFPDNTWARVAQKRLLALTH
jgi:hypothetical protein